MTTARRKNWILAGTCLVLVLAMGASLLLASATAADEQEETLLGTLSSRYEASGPGTISSGSGDLGGKSYGAYQFASKYDTPKKFFEWCQASDNTYYNEIGDRLEAAYYNGGAGYGTNFDNEWKKLAQENSTGFEQAQRNYVRLSYYDPIVSTIESAVPGFDMDNYSIALRNVFWSRAVQHGSGGAKNVITRAFAALGGFANQAENVIIDAIYAESGRVGTDGSYMMSGPTAEKYGIAGKSLYYFSGNSSSIQIGVYERLRINEPASAQQMLVTYGYQDAPLAEGIYRLQVENNSNLAAVASGSSVVINALADSDGQRFRFTYYASGYYIIENVATGQRLTANSDGSVTLAAPSTSNNQMWKVANFNSGFSLCNRGTGKYLTAASYSAGGRVNTSTTAKQWQLSLAGSGWSLSGASYPTYASGLQEGNSTFYFRGILRSAYPIQTVKVSVLDSNGRDAFTPATASPNATSYDLKNLDDAVAFSRLSGGSYTLRITATSTSPTDGTFVLESPFYVSTGEKIITFDANGGTCSESFRQAKPGQVYGTLPVPTKSGYTFVGWFTDRTGGTQVTASSIMPSSNITLYARYTQAYTYQFLNYDGSVVASGSLSAGQPIPAPQQTPQKPADSQYYYVFTGWAGYTANMAMPQNSVQFTAQFEAKPMTADQPITSPTYKVQSGLLRAIPLGTTVEQLQSDLLPKGAITIRQGSASTTERAATGMVVERTVDGSVVERVTVVVTGDINGDGKNTLTDMVQLQAHLLGRTALSEASFHAADLNGDGKVTITDMVQITSVLLGRSTIQPN